MEEKTSENHIFSLLACLLKAEYGLHPVFY